MFFEIILVIKPGKEAVAERLFSTLASNPEQILNQLANREGWGFNFYIGNYFYNWNHNSKNVL